MLVCCIEKVQIKQDTLVNPSELNAQETFFDRGVSIANTAGREPQGFASSSSVTDEKQKKGAAVAAPWLGVNGWRFICNCRLDWSRAQGLASYTIH